MKSTIMRISTHNVPVAQGRFIPLNWTLNSRNTSLGRGAESLEFTFIFHKKYSSTNTCYSSIKNSISQTFTQCPFLSSVSLRIPNITVL